MSRLFVRRSRWADPVGVRFVDRTIHRRFVADGFVVVPLVAPDVVAELRSAFDALDVQDASPFHVTLTGRAAADNYRVSDLIVGALSPGLDRLLEGYDVVGATFLVKESSDHSGLPVHQDWSSVDERHAVAVNVWCPLVDTSGRNGTLEVVPGSHRWFDGPRSPMLPSVELDLDGPVSPYLRRLDLLAGQVVVYDNRLFHGSHANTSPEPRPVAQLGLVSPGAQTVMAADLGHGRVGLKQVDVSAFFDGLSKSPGTVLESAPTLVTLAAASISADDVIARCRAGAGRHGSMRRVVQRVVDRATARPFGDSST